MRVLAIANQKGGVGKTTTTVALGGLIAQAGHRVLLLEIDPHGSMTTWFGLNPEIQAQSSYNLFHERKNLSVASVQALIQTTRFPRLHLIPATTALATLERQAIGQDGMGLVLTRALALLGDDYDYVLIDTPPLLGVLMVNALAASQHIVIPVQTEFLALKGLERMVNTLNMMSKSRKKPLGYSVVPVMFDRRTQASVTSLRSIRNTYPEQAWPGHIPVDTRLRDASKAGLPPHIFDPHSRGLEAYSSLWRWLERLLDEHENRAASQAASNIPTNSVAGGPTQLSSQRSLQRPLQPAKPGLAP